MQAAPRVSQESLVGLRRESPRPAVGQLLPPLYVMSISVAIWYSYTFYHLIPMISCHELPRARRGWCEFAIAQFLTAMYVICYIRTMFTHPGSVPAGEAWSRSNPTGPSLTAEVKLTGRRRSCKWCLTYKPDRCHHCRICKSCVLKMDHHCPWVLNCVGYRNQKFFFLLIIYAVCVCGFIAATVCETIKRSIDFEVPATNRFMAVFCFIFSFTCFLLSGIFLAFHLWLMSKGMTTVEFCEKNLTDPAFDRKTAIDYDHGMLNNLAGVFGANPCLWLLPLLPAEYFEEDAGLYFPAACGEVSAGKCENLISAKTDIISKLDFEPVEFDSHPELTPES